MEVIFIFLILFLLFFKPGDVISHNFLLFIAMQEDRLLVFHHLIPVFGIRIINIEWYLREIPN